MSEGKEAESKDDEPRLSGDEVLEKVSKYFYQNKKISTTVMQTVLAS